MCLLLHFNWAANEVLVVYSRLSPSLVKVWWNQTYSSTDDPVSQWKYKDFYVHSVNRTSWIGTRQLCSLQKTMYQWRSLEKILIRSIKIPLWSSGNKPHSKMMQDPLGKNVKACFREHDTSFSNRANPMESFGDVQGNDLSGLSIPSSMLELCEKHDCGWKEVL